MSVDLAQKSAPKNVLPRPGAKKIELIKRRTENVKTYINPDGTFSAEVYSTPVNYRDIHGRIEEINNKLHAVTGMASVGGIGENIYENTVNRFRVRFTQGTKSGKLLSILLENGKSIDIIPLNRIYQLGFTGDTVIDYDESNAETSLKYSLMGDVIKEEIVFYGTSKSNTFDFAVAVTGIRLEQDDDGRIWAIDVDEGNRLLYFDKSHATDVNGNTTENVVSSLQNIQDGYTITITIDSDWLAKAAFPVSVDPSIVTSVETIGAANIQDTFISSQNPSTDYHLNTYLRIGTLTNYGTIRSLVRFDYLPSLPPGAKITSAYLNLFMLNTTATATVSAYKVTSSWTASTVTWTAQPSYEEPPLKTGVTGTPNSYWAIDVTKSVDDWYNGVSANYGIMLRATTESDPSISFYSSDAAGHPTPSLTVNYEIDALGAEPYFGFYGNVNVYNGNLVLSDMDFTLPGRGIPITVSRTYNLRSTENTSLGSRWRINQDMKLSYKSGESVVRLTDGDGLFKYFVKNPEGTYTSPAGVDVKLSKVGTEFVLEDKSGVKYYFPNDKLGRIVDTNNNTTTFAYLSDGKINTITDPSGRSVVFDYPSGKLDSIKVNGASAVVYTYNGNNLETVTVKDTVTGTENNKVTFGYDAGNNLSSITDFKGNMTNITYYNTTGSDRRVQSIKKQLTIGDASPTDVITSFVYTKQTGGMVTEITDPNGIKTQYTTSNMGNVEKVIEDMGTEQWRLNLTTSFKWDQNQNLAQITPPKGDPNSDANMRYKTIIQYDNYNNLSRVVNANGETATFRHDGNNNPVEIVDTAGRPTINSFAETTRNLQSTINPIFATSVVNRDSFGNATAVTDPIGNGVNGVANPGFEYWASGLPTSWTLLYSNGTITNDAANKVSGKYGVKMTTTGSGTQNLALLSDFIEIEPSAKYNISWYVKTLGVGSANNGASVTVGFYNSSKAYMGVQYDASNLSPTFGTTMDFVRKGNRIDMPAGAKYAKIGLFVNAPGTVWFDNIQFEQGDVINNYNLLANPSFEINADNDTMPDSWQKGTLAADDGVFVDAAKAITGKNSFRITGVSGSKSFKQTISISGEIGVPLLFSGWVRGVGVQSGGDSIKLVLNLKYKLAVAETFTLLFAKTDNAQFQQKIVVSTKKFDQLELVAQVDGQAGAVFYFDDFTLRAYGSANALMSEYNIAYNGSFEFDMDNTGWPDDWPKYQVGTGTFNISWIDSTDTNRALTGKKMIKLDNVPNAAGVQTMIKEPINPSVVYTASAAIKTVGVTNGGAVIKLKVYDANDNEVGDRSSRVLAGTNDWTRIYVSLSGAEAQAMPNAAYIKIRVGTQAASTGQIYIDAVRFVQQGVETKYEYDTPKGNYITSVKNELGKVIAMQSDDKGNITRITDAKNNVYIFPQYENNRIKLSRNPLGFTSQYFYDKNGNLEQIDNYDIDQYLNTTIKIDYNELNLPKAIYDPKMQKTVFEYDLNGNLAEIKHPNGKSVQYVYDRVNRMDTIMFENSGVDVQSYEYDSHSNLTKIKKYGSEIIGYSYDDLDRVTTKTYKLVSADPNIIAYDYNPGSQLWSVNYSKLPDANKNIVYEYDQSGNNISIIGPYTTKCTFMHDEQRRYKKVFVEGPGHHYITYYYYNDLGSISRMFTENMNEIIIADFSYEYDDNNNRTKQTDNLTRTWIKYEYDSINQLVGEKNYNSSGVLVKSIVYEYDLRGNLKKKYVDSVITEAYEPNIANEIATRNGTADITYDANGNMTGNGGWEYLYNSANRMYQVKFNGTVKANYEYDEMGLRTQKVANGRTELYYYTGDKLTYVTQLSGTTNTLKYFFKRDASGKLLQMIDYTASPAQTYWYVQDAHGNIVALADKNGNKVVNYKYDAWGNLTNTPEGVTTGNGELLREANPFRYCSYQFDPETELYYLKARYYNPALARFLAKDPMLSINSYAYAVNNPVTLYDPDGRRVEAVSNGGGVSRPKIDYLAGAAISDYNRRMQAKEIQKNQQIAVDILSSALGSAGGVLEKIPAVYKEIHLDLAISYLAKRDYPLIGKILGGASRTMGYGFAIAPALLNKKYSTKEKLARAYVGAGGVLVGDIIGGVVVGILGATVLPEVIVGGIAFLVGIGVSSLYGYLTNKFLIEPNYGD